MGYPDLSQRQSDILDYIKACVTQKGYPPSIREICDAVGLSSPSTVYMHLNSLAQKGYLLRDAQTPRAITILDKAWENQTKKAELVSVPIVGRISAGLPTLAEENIEDYFSLPANFMSTNSPVFMLRVNGESMINVGINDGDMLIVEQACTAQNGEIAVVLIDSEATVKTFYKEKSRYRLQPENSSMAPIYVDHCEIIGKPIGLIRRF